MQYHLDGFRPGDPDVHPAAPGLRRAGCPVDGSLYGAEDQLAVTRDEPPKTLPSKG